MCFCLFFLMVRRPPISTRTYPLFPYASLFRSPAALGRAKAALVFTSGGPITAIVRQLLGLSDERAIRLNWTLANAAVTKLIYSERGIYLSTLNEHAHFEHDSSMITYR